MCGFLSSVFHLLTGTVNHSTPINASENLQKHIISKVGTNILQKATQTFGLVSSYRVSLISGV